MADTPAEAQMIHFLSQINSNLRDLVKSVEQANVRSLKRLTSIEKSLKIMAEARALPETQASESQILS